MQINVFTINLFWFHRWSPLKPNRGYALLFVRKYRRCRYDKLKLSIRWSGDHGVNRGRACYFGFWQVQRAQVNGKWMASGWQASGGQADGRQGNGRQGNGSQVNSKWKESKCIVSKWMESEWQMNGKHGKSRAIQRDDWTFSIENLLRLLWRLWRPQRPLSANCWMPIERLNCAQWTMWFVGESVFSLISPSVSKGLRKSLSVLWR